jgi:hypothetical protein
MAKQAVAKAENGKDSIGVAHIFQLLRIIVYYCNHSLKSLAA